MQCRDLATVSDETVELLREELTRWEAERRQAGAATAVSWITRTLPAHVVERCGAAVAAGAIDREDLSDRTTAWKWVVGCGSLESHTEQDDEEAREF